MRPSDIAACICGLLVLFRAASADAQSFERKLTLDTTPSLERTVALKLLQREAGQPVAAESVTTDVVDLDNDGFPEVFALTDTPTLCGPKGCRLRLYALIGDSYRDLLAGADAFAAVTPDQVVLNPWRRNGFVRIQFGPTVAVFEKDRYVDAAGIAPTKLDGAGFQSTCASNKLVTAAIENEGGDPAAGAQQICGCIASGFADWGMTQSELDFYGRYISGTVSTTQEQALGKDFHRMYVAGDEIKDACMIEQGWGSAPEFPGSAEEETDAPLTVEPFFETCAGQDWIRASGRIGSEDRAMAFCSCLAGSLAEAGLTQPDVDGLRQVYAGDVTEDELTETQPEAISTSDNESERCLGAMPLR